MKQNEHLYRSFRKDRPLFAHCDQRAVRFFVFGCCVQFGKQCLAQFAGSAGVFASILPILTAINESFDIIHKLSRKVVGGAKGCPHEYAHYTIYGSLSIVLISSHLYHWIGLQAKHRKL